MKRIAIIPARGGSKRIPRKNIRQFAGLPIIEYSIQSALKTQLFDVVMVSTDNDEIREIALRAGADVPFFRSENNSNDLATTADVISEVVDSYLKLGKEFDEALCIYPCAPFTTSAVLLNAHKLLQSGHFDCVFPIVEYSTPIQRALVIIDGKVTMKHPEFEFARSQDIDKSYFDAGQFYFFNLKSFQEQKTLRMKNTGAIILDKNHVQDIDEESDWTLAELKYQFLLNNVIE